MIGDLVQQGVTQNDYSVTGAMLAGGTIALLTVAVSYASFRFPRLRPVLDGEPVIVVEDGKPIERNLRAKRITLEELAAAARAGAASARSTRSAGRCSRRTGRSASSRSPLVDPGVPLYLTEADVEALLTPADAVARSRSASADGARAPSRTVRASGCRSRAASSRSWPRSTASSATPA